MVFEKIKQFIDEELNVSADTVTLDSRIAEDLVLDSIDAIELIMAVEDEFNIEISDEDATNIKTVGDLVDLINELIK